MTEHVWEYEKTVGGIQVYRCSAPNCIAKCTGLSNAATLPWDCPVQADIALDKQVGGDHYTKMAIQPVEFIHQNGIPFIEGCVIKYVSRWRNKNGVEDLRKARHFLDLLIEMEEKKP